MKVQQNAFVAIDYILTNDNGEIVDRSEEGNPLGFIWGQQQIIPGLEKALKGLEEGDKKKIDVAPKDGYGEASEELIQEFPRDSFPMDTVIKPGQTFQATTPHGPMRFSVKEVTDNIVVADLNHPLAGQELHFDVCIKEIRAATEEELNPPSHYCNSGSCDSCNHGH
jgi:FKBP-type peptidyl-prolyl cis-trans isomerase SlyD